MFYLFCCCCWYYCCCCCWASDSGMLLNWTCWWLSRAMWKDAFSIWFHGLFWMENGFGMLSMVLYRELLLQLPVCVCVCSNNRCCSYSLLLLLLLEILLVLLLLLLLYACILWMLILNIGHIQERNWWHLDRASTKSRFRQFRIKEMNRTTIQ